ncbi:MAG TPA: hypothetical protein VGI70_11400 [Polyangiales bacterium]
MAALLACVACGGDPSAKGDHGAAGTAADGGGSGGSSGVPCGATICKAPAGFIGELCCRDSFTATCGEKAMTDMCFPFPAQENASCPDGTLAENAGALLVRGCCLTDTNQCGLDVASAINTPIQVGQFCQPLADVEGLYPPVDAAVPVSNIPPATNCDGSPAM